MNKKHIGDSLDFMKRAVLSDCAHVFDNMIIEPLVSNDSWDEDDYQKYAAVLGVALDRVRHGAVPAWASRRSPKDRLEWLSTLNKHKGDLFFDPDTGLEPSSGGTHSHLPIRAIGELTGEGQERRVIMVYQHAPRGTNADCSDIEEKIRKKVASLMAETPRIHCLTTIGQVAFLLFFCRERDRLEKIKESLRWLDEAKRLKIISDKLR